MKKVKSISSVAIIAIMVSLTVPALGQDMNRTDDSNYSQTDRSKNNWGLLGLVGLLGLAGFMKRSRDVADANRPIR